MSKSVSVTECKTFLATLCLFIAMLAGLTTHAGAEVQLTIKEVTTIHPSHDGRYFDERRFRSWPAAFG